MFLLCTNLIFVYRFKPERKLRSSLYFFTVAIHSNNTPVISTPENRVSYAIAHASSNGNAPPGNSVISNVAASSNAIVSGRAGKSGLSPDMSAMKFDPQAIASAAQRSAAFVGNTVLCVGVTPLLAGAWYVGYISLMDKLPTPPTNNQHWGWKLLVCEALKIMADAPGFSDMKEFTQSFQPVFILKKMYDPTQAKDVRVGRYYNHAIGFTYCVAGKIHSPETELFHVIDKVKKALAHPDFKPLYMAIARSGAEKPTYCDLIEDNTPFWLSFKNCRPHYDRDPLNKFLLDEDIVKLATIATGTETPSTWPQDFIPALWQGGIVPRTLS